MKSLLGIISLVMLGCTLVVAGGVQAQDTDAPVIMIYGSINESSVSADFEPGESNFSLELFQGLRDRLIAEGFEPVFVRASESALYPDFFEPLSAYESQDNFWGIATLVSATSYDDSDAVTATQFAHFQFHPLPSGPFGMTPIAMVWPDRPASLDETVRMVAGVALFTGQYCDHALPLLIETSENETLISEGAALYSAMMFYRAGCDYLNGDIDQAIADYQAVIDYDHSEEGDETADPRVFSDNAAINLAWLYEKTDQPEAALALLDEYAQTRFARYEAREMRRFLERVALYMQLDEPARAIAELDRLVLIARDVNDEPDSFDFGNTGEFDDDEIARIYTERGVLYWKINEFDKALTDFNTAIETDATYPKAYYWRGVLTFDQGKDTAAEADFEQFLALAPDYSNYYEEDLDPLMDSAQTYILKIQRR